MEVFRPAAGANDLEVAPKPEQALSCRDLGGQPDGRRTAQFAGQVGGQSDLAHGPQVHDLIQRERAGWSGSLQVLKGEGDREDHAGPILQQDFGYESGSFGSELLAEGAPLQEAPDLVGREVGFDVRLELVFA